jgi:hypothetical protein
MGADGALKPLRMEPKPPLELAEHDREAIDAVLFLIGWAGGTLPVFLDGAPNYTLRLPAGEHDAATALVRRMARWTDRQVEIGIPSGTEQTVLWAWLETSKSIMWAERHFKRAARGRRGIPAPSVALRMGRSCRRLCLWALDEPTSSVIATPANKRIAYALSAPQKYAEPHQLRIPVPGTALRKDRKIPAPVIATRVTPDTFTRQQVAGHLKEPPRPFMERLRAGEIEKRK